MTIIRIAGMLSAADHKSHVPLAFDVPEGTTRLSGDIVFSVRDGEVGTPLVSISLYGPTGARGARHNNRDKRFVIDAAYASPGFLAGPVEPGRWLLFLDVFRLLGDGALAYDVTITCAQDVVTDADGESLPSPARHGWAWYKGDLHAHTLHSDGRWLPQDLVDWARHRGLDFLTVSDHNTISAVTEARRSAGNDLLVVAGMELTTHYGHALALGGNTLSEWRTGAVNGKTMAGLVSEIMDAGKTFVIAHPLIPGDPDCTGCRWEYADVMPGPARLVEIWNAGRWSDYNEAGLALYRQWLAAGHRLAATAGSDRHGPEDADGETGFNHVLAEALTEPAILSAVVAGRQYLSSGPRLVLGAPLANGALVPMGGTAHRVGGLVVQFGDITEPMQLRLIGPQGSAAQIDVTAGAEGEHAFDVVPRGFAMAELRAQDGRLCAVTNPIYLTD